MAAWVAHPLAGGSGHRAGHVGGRPCFVNEHQVLGIEVELAIEPALAPAKNIGAVLFGHGPGVL